MNTIITVDRAGRLVLPKAIRDRHGLEPGSELEITDAGSEIRLRPVAEASPLREVNGFLVYTGRFSGDQADPVHQDRAARLRRAAGR
jgi:AbrB family looped-hinge helix DNA binding protein